MHIVAIVIAVTANFCRPALLAAFGAGSRSVSCQAISPSSDGFSVMVGGKEGGRDGEEAREGIIEGTRDGALEGVRVGFLVGLRLGAALTCAAAVGTRVRARLVVASIFAVAVGAHVGARETMLAPLPPAAASVGGAVMAGEQAGGGALAAMHKELFCRAAGAHVAPASLPQQMGIVAKPTLAHDVAQWKVLYSVSNRFAEESWQYHAPITASAPETTNE